MEVTFAEEIESGRKTLLENCDNLEQIANYCEDNYVKAKDKKVALEETKNFTTQSLASVAYQINTLATSMLQMLDCTATKLGDMDSNMNQINLAIDLNNDRIARQTFRSSLLTPKDHTRSRKLTKPDNPPSFKQVIKYVSTPVDYGSLDDVGHGLKFGQPSSSPRGSRSGSLRSESSIGSGKNSLRQKSSKKSVRSPISIPSPTPSTNSLQPPVFTHEMYKDNSFTSDNSDRLPPPPSPSPPPPPAPSSFPPSPHQVSDGQDSGMNPEQDIKLASQQPPRPTSLMLSQSPSPRSPSSGSVNNSSHMLNIPGDERSSRSPGKTRKATVSRKASRSPRPTSRPPPPPSEAPPTASPSASGHIMSSEASNPLYFSESGASYPPPAPAPTPSDGPTSPPIIGGPPPPPPPPPPIGGVKSPSSSTHQKQSIPSAEKKPPAQATMNFADQLKQRLVKLESGKEDGGDQTLETSKKRDEPNNNRPVHSQPPPTTAVERGPATNFSSADGKVLNADRTVFISQETPNWAPSEFLWKGVALFDYKAMNVDEMTFKEGDVIYLTHDFKDGWLEGVCNGYRAMVPGNYVGQMP